MKKLLAVLLAAAMLGGCAEAVAANASSSESSLASVAESSKPNKNNAEDRKTAHMVFGKATGIEGNTITLLTMKGGPGHRPGRENRPHDKRHGPWEESEPADSQRPETEGSASNQPDEKPSDRPGRGQPPAGDAQKELQAEEKTITVADGCSILIDKDGQTTEGTLSDIKADDMISVEFSDDGTTPIKITVRTDGFKKQGGRPEDQNPSESVSTGSSSNPS